METHKMKRLKEIRKREDLKLRKTKHLKQTFTHWDGSERDLKLRYYQVQGVLHLLACERFLLGDDTGLGKTLQSIAAHCYVVEKEPEAECIILTNKSAVPQWAGEFEKFTNGFTVFQYKGAVKKRQKILKEYMDAPHPKVLVMGYRTAVRDIASFQDWEGFTLICDEATAFKTPATQCFQTCRHLGNQAKRVWALTATLIKNNLMEGWGIYQVVSPGLFPTAKTAFMNLFCIVRMQRIKGGRRQVPLVVGYRKDQILAFKERIEPYFLGRPKFEVAKELPPLTTKLVKFDMSNEQAHSYMEALDGLLEVFNAETQELEEKEVTKLTAVTYCQQIVNHLNLIGLDGRSAKLDALEELLLDGDLAGQKVIVFSRFRKMVDIIMETLKKKKVKCTRITGSEDEDQRRAAQQAFQDPKNDTNIICITTAATEAVNLQAAKAIIFYDTPWSGGDYLQALGRMIRIGSEHDKVYAFHLVTKDSIDQRVMEALKRKLKLIEAIIGKRLKGETDDFEVSTTNDISDLFSQLVNDARARTTK
tara:strand:+ start:2200 stop:3798 length:1599 start_codon:yes stop_codon:yes gene_type:complete